MDSKTTKGGHGLHQQEWQPIPSFLPLKKNKINPFFFASSLSTISLMPKKISFLLLFSFHPRKPHFPFFGPSIFSSYKLLTPISFFCGFYSQIERALRGSRGWQLLGQHGHCKGSMALVCLACELEQHVACPWCMENWRCKAWGAAGVCSAGACCCRSSREEQASVGKWCVCLSLATGTRGCKARM